MSTRQSMIAPEKLEFLWEHRDQLTDDERQRLKVLIEREYRGFRTNRFIRALRPNLTPGHPRDNPKQRALLGMDCLEAMFGGAAGGGKSDALLLAALQYVDVPGYSAILFRKTYTDLSGQGAIMDRCRQWLLPFEGYGVHWSAQDKSYFFDTFNPDGSPGQPARLAFGYLDNENDKYRYQGWEFAFCGFDELTQHPEENYTYLFSRLRRLEGVDIPIRMRSATNPGGRHGDWVKERFIPKAYLEADIETQFSNIWKNRRECEDCMGTGETENGKCLYCAGSGASERIFIPARIQDNPSLDQKQYQRALRELTPVERARLESGRWDVMEEGHLFEETWFKYYSRNGLHFHLHQDAGPPKTIGEQNVDYFLTVDTASKTKTQNDWTVISTWGLASNTYDLFLVYALRKKMQVPELMPALIQQWNRCIAMQERSPMFAMIEDASSGIGLIQEARTAAGKGMTIKAYSPHDGDVVSRATPAIIRMEAGQIWFPMGRSDWLSDFTIELLAFDGDKEKHDDCVATLSMAAHYVNNLHKGSQDASAPVASAGPAFNRIQFN